MSNYCEQNRNGQHVWIPIFTEPGTRAACLHCSAKLLAEDTPPGEAEHEWVWHPRRRIFKCKLTSQSRTVADFWKAQPPQHPNPDAQCYGRYFSVNKSAWTKPMLFKLTDIALVTSDCLDYEFFHHPDYIILPPPVPPEKDHA